MTQRRGVLAGVLLVATPVWAQDPEFARRAIVSDHDSVLSVTAADIDGDGDMDVFSAAKGDELGKAGVFLLENVGGSPPQFLESQISLVPSREVHVADLDLDGDLDVIDGYLTWHENTGGTPPQFVAHDFFIFNLSNNSTRTGDVDSDGLVDIVCAVKTQDASVYWFENLGGTPPTFFGYPLTTPPASPLDNVLEADLADLDGDGDLDVLAVSEQPNNPDSGFNRVVWWENDGADNPAFIFHEVDATLRAPLSINAADFDGDTDLDFVVAVAADGRIVWFENDGTSPPSFTIQDVAIGYDVPISVQPADVDGDGDQDVLACSVTGARLSLFENDGGSPPGWIERILSDDLPFASDAWAADLDADGDTDIIGGFYGADTVAWFERAALIENVSAGTTHPTFADAVSNASPGDTILAEPSRFIAELDLDCAGKALRIESTGPVLQDPRATYTLAEGAVIAAAPGEVMEVRGDLITPGGENAEIHASGGVLLEQSVSVSDGATLLVNGPAEFETVRRFKTLVLSLDPDSSIADVPVTGAEGYSNGPESIEFVDLNGDGLDDVATADDGYVSVYLAVPGDPLSFTATRVETDPGHKFYTLRCGDLDSDGDVDLVAFGLDLRVYLNDGAATPAWVASNVYAVPLNTYNGCGLLPAGLALDVGDLDADGDLDIVAGSAGEGLFWFESDGNAPPSFTLRSFPGGVSGTGEGCSFAGVVDINGDGAQDVVSLVGGECVPFSVAYGPLRIFYGQVESPGSFVYSECKRICSDGAFGPCDNDPFFPFSYCYAGATDFDALQTFFQVPDRLEFGDFDRDGDTDIAVANLSLDVLALSGLRWLENLGGTDPLFNVRVSDDGPVFGKLAAADFDGDGDTDLLLADRFQRRLSLYESDGAELPQFDRFVLDSEIFKATDVSVGDWNADGILDVAYTGERLDDVRVLIFQDFGEIAATGLGSRVEFSGGLSVKRATLRPSSGATIAATGSISVDRELGVVEGSGTIDADVSNDGTLGAEPGATLTIDGDLATTGAIVADLTPLASGGSATLLDVTGSATLGGALVTVSGVALDPLSISAPALLTAGSITPGSRFSVALLPNVGSADFLSVVYDEGAARSSGARSAATVFLQVNPLSGDVELDPQASADSGAAGVPKGATLADIDGDGDDDLLIALPAATSPTTTPGSVVILYNDDDGIVANGWEGFGATAQIFAGVGVNPSSVAVGLIDADAQPDIVVSNRGTPGAGAPDTVGVLLVDDPSPGSFSTSATFLVSVGDEPADVIIADLDVDGRPDIGVANAGSDSVTVLFTTGSGSAPSDFVPVELDLPEGECPLSIEPGDFDASFYRPFLATANGAGDSVSVIQPNPDRSLTLIATIPVGNDPVELIVADLDLDGEDDIATVNRAGNSVSILLNASNGAPTLAMGPASTLPIGADTELPRSIAAGDFDSDASGDIDLAVLADGVVKVLRNDLAGGQLAFTPMPDQPAGADPLLLRAGDLNRDGKDDVLTVAESTAAKGAARGTQPGAVNTLLATPPSPGCAGDLDADNDTDVFDFTIFASNFGSTVAPGTGGDADGDGDVDVLDFGVFASDFGCVP